MGSMGKTINGFASKLLIYESTFQLNPILAIVAILSSIMLLAVFIKVFHSAFLGPALPKFSEVKEVPKTMLFAMGIIASLIIVFGLFPDLIINNIVEPAVNALINYNDYIRQVIPTFTGGVTTISGNSLAAACSARCCAARKSVPMAR